ncbi:MAG: hypothetical protein JWM28_2244 [Chitinophagaceae bacterium]|nr:hypothetical protein [Chitinophagaceae bacterium]
MLQYRYYYNAARREKKGKRIAMNSLNYLSPFFETVFFKKSTYTWEDVETYRRTINTIGLVWGMQRNYNSRFSLDFESGIGYRFGKITSQSSSGQISTRTGGAMTLIININLGIWLNKRQ